MCNLGVTQWLKSGLYNHVPSSKTVLAHLLLPLSLCHLLCRSLLLMTLMTRPLSEKHMNRVTDCHGQYVLHQITETILSTMHCRSAELPLPCRRPSCLLPGRQNRSCSTTPAATELLIVQVCYLVLNIWREIEFNVVPFWHRRWKFKSRFNVRHSRVA